MTVETAQDTPNAGQSAVSDPSANPQVDNGQGAEGDKQANGPAKTALSAASNGDDQNANGDKPDTNSTDGDDGQNKDEGKTEGAPEEYGQFTLPDYVELSGEALTEFQTMAKEANMPQEMAQKFLDKGANLIKETQDQMIEALQTDYAKKVSKWHETRANDPEIGGTQEKQNLVLSEAARVARAVGGDKFMEALDETGAGNHPEIIRFIHKFKDLVGPDGKFIQSQNSGGGPKTAAQALYPDLPSVAS